MGKAWIQYHDYVDVETGLLISKKQANREYYIKKGTPKIEYNGKYNIKRYIHECRRSDQIKLF